MGRTSRFGYLAATVGFCFLFSGHALAGSHLWKINEIFSNVDGSVQFIELKECCGSTIETAIGGKIVVSIATGNVFTFPSNLVGPTSNRYLLLATPAFAALPGAPTPDYFLPVGIAGFFARGGDTIRWSPINNYDNFTFGAGQLPSDGVNSIHITNYTTHTFITSPNSPTNYAGGTGSIDAGCIDHDGDGYGTPGAAACAGGDEVDCNDTVAAINPGAVENCADQFDNNCDDFVDCEDSSCFAFCAGAPGCAPCRLYGDVAPLGCIIDLDDILYVIDSFQNPVAFPYGDIEPCEGDGDVDVDDLLAELNSFSGTYACSHPCPPGACYGEFQDSPPDPTECRDQFSAGGGMSEADCFLDTLGLGIFCGTGTLCGDPGCPP